MFRKWFSVIAIGICSFQAVISQVLEEPTPQNQIIAVFPSELLAKFPDKEKIDLFVETDATGKVTSVISFGPWVTCDKNDETAATLQRVAVEAAKKMIFSPAKRDGKSVSGFAVFSYALEGTEPKSTLNGISRSGAVVNGLSISKPIPKYPSRARKFGVQGPVTIELLINEEGKPISARAKSGHPLLLENAAKAACDARWTPTLLGGSPVKVGARITYNFVP